MFKKVVFAICSLMIAGAVHAQDHMPQRYNTYVDDDGSGFRANRLFLGGSLQLGIGSYNFDVGVNPEVGYSLNRWLDVGAVVNFTYSSVRADPNYYYNPDVSSKEFIYGGGVFGRAYVLPFLFLTAQPEYNWTSIKETDEGTGATVAPRSTYSVSAPSLLLGLGYGQRAVGESGFFIELMFDAISNSNSPYNDAFGHPLPVLRAGFDFYLGKK
jgi:hypothetical protein